MPDTARRDRPHRRSLFVEVQVRDADDDSVYMHQARNVSTGGMFLDAPVPFPPGTKLGVQFELPGEGPLQCEAEVRWNTEIIAGGAPVPHPGMGVGFVGLGPDARRLLRAFVGANEG